MKRLSISVLLFLALTPLPLAPLLFAECSNDPAPSLQQILESPEELIGCQVQIEGVLESEDAGDRMIYSIQTGLGQSLPVWSWAPEGQSRYPSQNADALRPMASFVGRRLSLVGKLVQERSGKVVLEVSWVHVLDEPAE